MKNRQQEIATPTLCETDKFSGSAKDSCNKRKLTHTRKLTYLATMTAISIALKVISNALSALVPPAFKISFAYLGWYLSAIIVGPLGGGIVAIISDVLGQFVFGTAPYPLITLGNFCASFVFGVVFKLLPVKNRPLRALIAVTVSLLFGTLGFNTLGLYQLYYAGSNYGAYFVTRLFQLPVAYLNAALTVTLFPYVEKLRLADLDYVKLTKRHVDSPS